MKKQVRVAVVLVVAALVLGIIAMQNVTGYPTYNDPCTDCHSNPGGIIITAPTSVDVEQGNDFSLYIIVDGIDDQNALAMKFQDGRADNDQFVFAGLPDDGLVEDGDSADLNPAADLIEVNYTVTGPALTGQYTMRLYVAQHTPYGTEYDITVNVIPPPGPGPSILSVETDIDDLVLANETVTVVANVTSDVEIVEVTLQYNTNGSAWVNVTMVETDGLYTATIPNFQVNTVVEFRIVALDSDGIEAISGTSTYTVSDIPEPPPPPPVILHYGWLLGFPALFFAYLGSALEYYDEERFTRIHGIMLTLAYVLTSINVITLIGLDPMAWNAMAIENLFNIGNLLVFMHAWHIWIGIISMILGTLALLTHLGGWKTCNLGLPAVILWTVLGFQGLYLGVFFK
ncbi:MAG: hypothetical protein ACFE7R_01750 [Candidatus Hodarchaeota archaeon]